MGVAATLLLTWVSLPLAAPAPRAQILPFTAATPDTNAQAVKDMEGLYRDAMQRVLGERVVGGGQVREELAMAAKDNPVLRTVTAENVKYLPGLFNGGPLHVTEVKGDYPDLRVTFRSFDGVTRALLASHVERFTAPP